MKKTKKIAAITMARNDEFFLSRWVEYYGKEIGYENLYILLDGMDQVPPKNARNANIIKQSHTDMSRLEGDKHRIGIISKYAKELLKKYDIVIGCDTDEFIIREEQIRIFLYIGDLSSCLIYSKNISVFQTNYSLRWNEIFHFHEFLLQNLATFTSAFLCLRSFNQTPYNGTNKR